MFTIYALYSEANLTEVEHTRSKAQALYILEEVASLGVPGWVIQHGTTVAHCHGGKVDSRSLRVRLVDQFRDLMDRWADETARRHNLSYAEAEALASLASTRKEWTDEREHHQRYSGNAGSP